MECRRHVEELAVEAQLPLAALLGPEQVDADRMVEEQLRGMLPQDVRCLFRQQGIGNGEDVRAVRHGQLRREEIRAESAFQNPLC